MDLISEPKIMRDIQFVKISLIPFIYNSINSTLEIFDEVEIEIIEIDDPDYIPSEEMLGSLVFEKLYLS